VAVAVVLSVVGYMVYLYSRPKLLTQINGDSTEGQTSNSDAEIIFFFADWCPHCKKAKPHWEEVKQSYSGKVVNGYTMVFTEVDCSKETEEMKKTTAEYEIEGYPTIKLVRSSSTTPSRTRIPWRSSSTRLFRLGRVFDMCHHTICSLNIAII
jgi:thiol-disulfide isomerase/thioredoxin